MAIADGPSSIATQAPTNKAFFDVPGDIKQRSFGTGTASNGDNVTALKQTSALEASTDIAEEISQALTKFKKWDKREVGQSDSHQENMLELIRKIQAVEKIDGIDEFKNDLANKPNLTSKDYQREAEKKFPDAFHQYIALYEAAMAFEQANGKGSADEIFSAVDNLKRDNRQAIQIGLNLTEEAARLSDETGLMSIPETRREYQDHVKDHKSLNQAYVEINKRHGSKNFETAVDIQLKLLATDLACVDKSTSGTRLKAILDDMQKLKVLVGVHDNCVETQEQIARAPFNLEVAAHEYLGSILGLIDRQWITEADFSGLAKEMNVNELQAKIFFMNKTAETVRMLPEEIFVNVEAKQQMVSAVQEVQDSLVIQEEGSDKPIDDKDGIIGEIDVQSNGILNDIAHQMGYDLSGSSSENKMPGVLQKSSAQAADTKKSAVEANSGNEGATNVSASEPESYRGLSDEKLVEIQDVKLKRADEIQQLNGEKYVFDSAVDALKRAQENGPGEVLKTLKALTQKRGESVARSLKVHIIPDGQKEAINLIPPDKILKDKTPEEINDLVQTAIDLLEAQSAKQFKSVDFIQLQKELEDLRRSIMELDRNMKTKVNNRSKGMKQFYQLELRKVAVHASGAGVAVGAAEDYDARDENTLKIQRAKATGRPQALRPTVKAAKTTKFDMDDDGYNSESDFEGEPDDNGPVYNPGDVDFSPDAGSFNDDGAGGENPQPDDGQPEGQGDQTGDGDFDEGFGDGTEVN
ncbi:TyeA family type III secretion system gatekeeper subunit [Endozoicomonas ascidiicola]|uniref:TyeA family type III secretion system gatekeeper subunit n=1 Tax=Endozoicomonas ascidiicola TaxID=1698521 RepID=UPI0008339211|nr:TyeA family type III secretion system gatekeeper subunit [Endozoicomonas ascidiicola]